MSKSISDGRINGNIIPGRPDSNASIHFKLRSGRDRAQIKRWWNSGGSHKNYIDCSAAQLSMGGKDDCKFWLVWPHNYDTRLDVEWSLKFGTLEFTKFRHATRAALLCEDGSVLSHYVFGKQPGVKPREFKIRDPWVCADDCIPGEGLRCFYIYELPDLDSFGLPAPKSVDIFDECVDVPSLPLLV